MKKVQKVQPIQINKRGSETESALETIYLDPKPPIHFQMDNRRKLRT